MLTKYITRSTRLITSQSKMKWAAVDHSKSKGDNYLILILKNQVYNGTTKV